MSDNVVSYSISATLGALLVGGFSCTLWVKCTRLPGGNMADYVSTRRLSGIVSMQAYLYARVYRNDRLRLKSLVWLLPLRRPSYSILTINHRFYLFGMAKTRGSILYCTHCVTQAIGHSSYRDGQHIQLALSDRQFWKPGGP